MNASVVCAALAAVASVPLTISIDARGDRGFVYCAAWAEKDGFPTKRAKSVGEGRSQVIEGKAEIRMRLPAGEGLALACFHDENENERLDRNFLGIPSEGTGASNDARPKFGPPRYRDARFPLTGSSTVVVTIHY